MKIRPVEAELFHADGRTEVEKDGNSHDEANVAFPNFTNESKNFILRAVFIG